MREHCVSQLAPHAEGSRTEHAWAKAKPREGLSPRRTLVYIKGKSVGVPIAEPPDFLLAYNKNKKEVTIKTSK